MKFSLLFLLVCFAAQADVYRSVDEHGNVTFSDLPTNDSEAIELGVLPTYSPVAIPEEQPVDELLTDELAEPNYKIAITSPAKNESFWETSGTVTVSVDIRPELSVERGDLIVFKLDGQAVGQAQSSPTFTMTNINRGSHIVVASIIDTTGKVLKTSKSVLFHLHRRSLINNPASKNQLLPAPRPAKAAPNAATNN